MTNNAAQMAISVPDESRFREAALKLFSRLLGGQLPFPSLIIDAGWKDVFVNCLAAAGSYDRQRVLRSIESKFTAGPNNNSQALVTLSVRSALDLWLRVMKFPEGSELVMTAINIPDMTKIIEEHGIVPVPVDLEANTLAVNMEMLNRVVNSKTVGVMIAHVFGRRNELDEVAKFTRERKLYLIEDCAESLHGLEFTGSPVADLALFSFGPIKNVTAFGGAIVRIRDSKLAKSMRTIHEAQQQQSEKEYVKRVLTYSSALAILNVPLVTGLFITILAKLNVDHKELAVSLLRGFPTGLIQKIRRKPSNAVLVALRRRLENVDLSRYEDNTRRCDYVSEKIKDTVLVPGLDAASRNYWLYPIVVPSGLREKVYDILVRKGIDAYKKSTQLTVIMPPNDSFPVPIVAKQIMDNVLYLPVHRLSPGFVLDSVAQGVVAAVNQAEGEAASKL